MGAGRSAPYEPWAGREGQEVLRDGKKRQEGFYEQQEGGKSLS